MYYDKKMSGITGKRITYKRKKPNPVFEECLQKLYLEAKEKNSKHEPILKEALLSLTKYPLPLKSGADCAILKGFDKKLCLLLDKYVVEFNSKDNVAQTSIQKEYTTDNRTYNNIRKSPKAQDLYVRLDHLQNTASNSIDIEANKFPKTTSNLYDSVYQSGGYALLMGLLEHSKRNLENTLKKDELIEIAQKYCDESLTTSKSVKYSAWSSMARLLSKGLVTKSRGKKIEYTLTEEGVILANKLWEDNKNKPSTNDIICSSTSSRVLSPEQLKNSEEAPVIVTSENEGSESIVNVNLNNHVINMPVNSFDIILLIDKNEKNGNSKDDPFRIYPDLRYELRSLKVGDFTWIARHRANGCEFVLPYIVERKRMDDLGASIKDGRFHEQKFRLRKCGLDNVFYLVESHEKNKHVGLPMPSLMQALANTRIQDGFKVYFTDSLIKSHRFLAMMTKRLEVEYMNKSLQGSNSDATMEILMTFDYFNKSSVKTKVLSVTEMFIKMLLQLKGMSVEKALAITSIYQTPKSLMKTYEIHNEKEGEILLANLKYGELNRNVGPSVSKAVFQLLTFE